MKKKAIIGFVCFVLGFCQLSLAQTYEFDFDNLPWNKTKQDIIGMLKQCDVNNDEYVFAPETMSSVGVARDWYVDGLYSNAFATVRLHSNIVEALSIKCEDWKTTYSVKLYYLKSSGQLFIVEKQLHIPEGNYQQGYENLKDVIKKKIKTRPEEKETIFQNSDYKANNNYALAKVGRWKSESVHVLLSVVEGFFPGTSDYAFLLYINSNRWVHYLKLAKEEDSRLEKKIKNETSDKYDKL